MLLGRLHLFVLPVTRGDMRYVLHWLVMAGIIVSLMPLDMPVAAQSPTASVSIECDELIPIEVSPGLSGIGTVTCTVSNPTVYQEKIDITVNASNLAHSAPGSVTVGPGEDLDFQVTYRAEENMLKQAITSIVNAQVVEMNGAPPPNVAEDDSSIMIDILQFGKCDVQLTEAYVEFNVNVVFDVKLKLFNLGNGNDMIKIGIEDYSLDMLEEAGFVISFPMNSVNMDPQGAPEIVFFNLKTPSTSSSSAVLENGFLTEYFTIDIYAMSDYECKNSGCEKSSVTLTLKLLESPTEEPQSEESEVGLDVKSDQTMLYASGGGVILLLIFGLFFFRKS